ncbi:hypothetical protein [Pseudofrankia saprophytica]|uniref:hypothetical protein n=1 Tax=Pseudofrankia saprophytica TaxID=298655 RepID=UPI000234D034|nr:hypothetical protein [Pseudofrankia saprophytica]
MIMGYRSVSIEGAEIRTKERSPIKMLAVGIVLLGLFFIAIGLKSQADQNSPVTCDGKLMNRGDTCIVTYNGSTSRADYDEMAHRKESASSDAFVVGLPIVMVGVVVFLVGQVVEMRNAKELERIRMARRRSGKG